MLTTAFLCCDYDWIETLVFIFPELFLYTSIGYLIKIVYSVVLNEMMPIFIKNYICLGAPDCHDSCCIQDDFSG